MSRKRVLFICNPMYNYYKKITSEFELHGFDVDYYNDKPNESSFNKGVAKVKKDLLKPLMQKYFNNIMDEIQDKSYDLVFMANCKLFTKEMINKLKENQKSARFVLYMWDSLKRYPDNIKLISLFHTVYSFDLDDCEKIDGLTFCPLYYCRDFEEVRKVQDSQFKYDIVSICTAHPNRYKTMKVLFPKLEANGLKIFSYMYINKLQYLYNRVFVPEFRSAKRNEFNFSPLYDRKNLEILSKSNTVFDMPVDKQSGLTLRTIETLGAKKKLITTNKEIKKYDFYNENNILVWDKNNPDEIEDFINKKYEDVDDEIYKKYSISSWIDRIINNIDSKYLI